MTAGAFTSKTPRIRVAGNEIEKLKRDAREILWGCGIDYSPNKIARLVLTFKKRVEGNGWEFFHFLANAVQLDADQRRRALANPEIARVISYADPTGETAVRKVMREAR